jgi:hypothetical protein
VVDCTFYVLEGVRCVLLCLVEAVEDVCYVLGLPKVVFYALGVLEGRASAMCWKLCSVFDVLEGVCCALFCMLEVRHCRL